VRDGQVFGLIRCPGCGPVERLVASDAVAYQRSFLARAQVPAGHRGDWRWKGTTSTCPTGASTGS
jgi:hypothetical protein